MIEVVDPDDPARGVGYGETGRVRLTTLTREFFMPRFLERDEAEREPSYTEYPWDGVRNVRPFSRLQKTVVEGVYGCSKPSSKQRRRWCTSRCCGAAGRTAASISRARRTTAPASRSSTSDRKSARL